MEAIYQALFAAAGLLFLFCGIHHSLQHRLFLSLLFRQGYIEEQLQCSAGYRIRYRHNALPPTGLSVLQQNYTRYDRRIRIT